jgi:hypothetical protein
MYYEIEETGCCEHRGKMQVRYSVYLEPGDYGYEKHNITIPVIPEEGYPGIMIGGIPASHEDFQTWLQSLPTKAVNNPFHNHLSYFDSMVTENELKREGRRILKEAKGHWNEDRVPRIINVDMVFDDVASIKVKNNIKNKLDSLKLKIISGRLTD